VVRQADVTDPMGRPAQAMMRMLAHPPASEDETDLSRYDWTKAARGKYAGRTRAAAKEQAWTEAQLANPAVCRAALDECYALLQHEREVHEAREMEAMAQTTRAQQRFHKSLAVYETAKDLLAETAGFHEEGSRIGRSRRRLEKAVDQFDVDTARIAREGKSVWGVFDTWNRRWCPRLGTEEEMGTLAGSMNRNPNHAPEESNESVYRYQPLPLPDVEAKP